MPALTIRCSAKELVAWHHYAHDKEITLSEMLRTMLNNMSGLNSPPEFDLWSDDDLIAYANTCTLVVKARRRQARLLARTHGRAASGGAAAVAVALELLPL